MSILTDIPVVIHIRKNITGEIRSFEDTLPIDEYEVPGTPSVFLWEEGNYRCDCNRELFFLRDDKESIDYKALKCGMANYSVNIYQEGICIYNEF